MWNKIESQEVKALKEKVEDLNRQLEKALLKNINMSIEKPKASVIVYLKDNQVLRVRDTDDYSITKDDYAMIYKGESIVASVRKEDIIAISMNDISVDYTQWQHRENVKGEEHELK